MKIRDGFVSNSSSSSYLVFYKEESFLPSAKAILNQIEKDPKSEIILFGKELGEGNDWGLLTHKQKKLILKFPEIWKRNEGIFGILQEDCDWIDTTYRDDISDVKIDPSLTNSLKFERNNYCITDDECLEEFFLLYFAEEDDLESDDITSLPKVKPFALKYKSSIENITEGQWNKVQRDPDNYPILIVQREKDKDYVRALRALHDPVDFPLSDLNIILIRSAGYPFDKVKGEVLIHGSIIEEESLQYDSDCFYIKPFIGTFHKKVFK